MGRQGPRLVPFLQDGMNKKKYRNLITEDPSGLIFSIVLPHKTKKLDMEDELIFKDWYALNGKKYVFHSKHYTDAKQAITASLRKSDYVEKIHISDDRLTYRILNKAEVKDKKRLKKELKKLKEEKMEASESDDASSSVESGYGSGAESPGTDHTQSLNENFITPNGNDSSPLFNTMAANVLFGINDALQNTCSDKFEIFKTEPMDTSILSDNSLAVPGAPVLFGEDLFTHNLKSTDFFPENTEHSANNLNLMESFEAPESYSSNFEEPLSFENESDFPPLDLSGLVNYLLKDNPVFNTDFSLMHEENINNQSSETQKDDELQREPEDNLTEKLWANLIEDIPAVDSHPLMPSCEEKFPEPISSFPDGGFTDHKMEPGEKVYLFKKCIHLGKIPVLFFEPQFEKNPETSGALKIVFDAAVLKEINSCKSIKEYKFINDHLMVILEPNDE